MAESQNIEYKESWRDEEQIIISNRCILPEGWTTETLMQPHDSIPYNPDIANVFRRRR